MDISFKRKTRDGATTEIKVKELPPWIALCLIGCTVIAVALWLFK